MKKLIFRENVQSDQDQLNDNDDDHHHSIPNNTNNNSNNNIDELFNNPRFLINLEKSNEKMITTILKKLGVGNKRKLNDLEIDDNESSIAVYPQTKRTQLNPALQLNPFGQLNNTYQFQPDSNAVEFFNFPFFFYFFTPSQFYHFPIFPFFI